MITIRGQSLGKMSAEEVKQFIEWTKEAESRTTFDHGIIGYPRCAMLITEDSEGPVSYLPCQTVLMAEVFIPKPGASKKEKVKSLKLIDDGLIQIAKGMDVGEVYLYVPETEVAYANQLEREGWEEVEAVRLFKKRTGVKVNGRRSQ